MYGCLVDARREMTRNEPGRRRGGRELDRDKV